MDSYMQSVYSQVEKEYEKIRTQNAENHKQIVSKIYSHIPKIKEIDQKLQNVGLSVCGQVLNGSISAEKAVSQMQQEVDLLIQEKNELLKKADICLCIMDEIYTCDKCKDRGFVDGKRCKCFYDKLYLVLRRMSNVCANSKNTFKKFNLDLYSKEKDEEYGISPYENAKLTLSLAKKYVTDEYKGTQNLLFYGSPGLGKTFTSDCIANEFIKNGKPVLYMSAPKLFSMFEDYKFGRDTSDYVKTTINAVTQTNLLIIDDLGTEFRTNYSDSILFDVINTRLNENKKMIISTNLNPSQITDIYSERISSRILGGFERIPFFGDDIRIKQA